MDLYSDDHSQPEFEKGLQEDLELVHFSCIITSADMGAAVAHVSSYLAAGLLPPRCPWYNNDGGN